MDGRDLVRKSVYGAAGGVTGGLLFGPIMAVSGILPLVAMLIGQREEWIGFSVHMGISLLFGFWFGLISSFLGQFNNGLSRSTLLGTLYGFVWWILGGLTLMPAFLGMPPQFSNATNTMNLGSLLGHLVYGVALGIVYGYLHRIGFMKASPVSPPAAAPASLIKPRAR